MSTKKTNRAARGRYQPTARDSDLYRPDLVAEVLVKYGKLNECDAMHPDRVRQLTGVGQCECLEPEKFSIDGLVVLPSLIGPEFCPSGIFATDNPEAVERVANKLFAQSLRLQQRQAVLRRLAAELRQARAMQFAQGCCGFAPECAGQGTSARPDSLPDQTAGLAWVKPAAPSNRSRRNGCGAD